MIADNCLMNITNLCFNVDVKVNLDNSDRGSPRLLLEIKVRILILDDFYWKFIGIYVGKEVLWTLDINSQLGFFNFWSS